MPKSAGFQEWVDATCFSVFEGCACHKARNHVEAGDDQHLCGADGCRTVWDDEQAREWMREIATTQEEDANDEGALDDA